MNPNRGTPPAVASTARRHLVSRWLIGYRFSVVGAECQDSVDNRQPITDNTGSLETLFRELYQG